MNSNNNKNKSSEPKVKKSGNYYFTKDTQKTIEQYQKAETKRIKNKLYTDNIQPAFEELVHNLVSVYNFKASSEDISHLKHDCITFLFETIPKWNPNNGTKAFSYFNVVAKNWLTIHSRRLLKISKRNVSVDFPEEFTQQEKRKLKEMETDAETEYMEEIRLDSLPVLLQEMIDDIGDKVKDEKDVKCINAIKQVFENVDNLDFLNKRAIFIYLREISGLNSAELSSSLSNIRKHYKKICGPNKKFDLF